MAIDAPTPPPALESDIDLRVIRGVGRCLALSLVSLGWWSYAWVWHVTKEVSKRLDPEASPGLRAVGTFIPLLNIYVLYLCWRDVNAYCARAGVRGFPVIPYVVLSIFIVPVLFTYPSVQLRLNAAHEAATGGAAVRAPLAAPDWITLGLSLIIWVPFVGGFIAGGASGS